MFSVIWNPIIYSVRSLVMDPAWTFLVNLSQCRDVDFSGGLDQP